MADLGVLPGREADGGKPIWESMDVCSEAGGAAAEGPASSLLTSSWEAWKAEDFALVWVGWSGRAWESCLLEVPATGAAVDEDA